MYFHVKIADFTDKKHVILHRLNNIRTVLQYVIFPNKTTTSLKTQAYCKHKRNYIHRYLVQNCCVILVFFVFPSTIFVLEFRSFLRNCEIFRHIQLIWEIFIVCAPRTSRLHSAFIQGAHMMHLKLRITTYASMQFRLLGPSVRIPLRT